MIAMFAGSPAPELAASSSTMPVHISVLICSRLTSSSQVLSLAESPYIQHSRQVRLQAQLTKTVT